MAVVRNLVVRAGADFSQFTKQTKKAQSSFSKMASGIQKSTNLLKGALGAVGIGLSIGAIVAAGREAVQAYNAQAEAEAKLAAVMKNTMSAAEGEIQSIKNLTAAQEQLGVVDQEFQLAGAQELATYLEYSQSLGTLIPVMNDMIAQQYGFNQSAESAVNIATMLGKVMEGQTGALSRYGYYFDEAQSNILKYGTEAERAAVLAEIVEGSVGGMNKALAQTPTGRMKQLAFTLGGIQENFGAAITQIGVVFLPLLNTVANVLASIANFASKVASVIASVFGGGGGGGAAADQMAYGAAVGGAADATEDLADATEAAGKAAKKSVFGFDALNKVTAPSSGGGSGAAAGGGGGGGYGGGGAFSFPGPDEEDLDKLANLQEHLEKIKEKIDRIKTAWGEFREKYKLPKLEWGEKDWEAIEGVLDSIARGIELINDDQHLRGTLALLGIEPIENSWIDKLISSFDEETAAMIQKFNDGDHFGGWVTLLFGANSALGQFLLLMQDLVEADWSSFDAGIIWTGFVTEFKRELDIINEKLEPFKEAWGSFLDTIQNKIDTWWEKLEKIFKKIREGFNDFFEPLREQFDELKSWWSGLSLSGFHVRWPRISISQTEVGGAFAQMLGVTAIPHINVSWVDSYATGGFPEDGLFMANHGELVGKFSNGQTAVANNAQIIEGIKRGVMEAMSASGGWKVFLDGKELADNTTRWQRRAAVAGGY